jgi:hypothetical protein
MAQQWNGILLRSDLGDRGMIPRDALANSPDIILAGTTPLPDPRMLTEPGQYDRVVDPGFHVGWPNYLYVRGKNGTSGSLSGRWSLFQATPNILLWPYLWERNAIATSAGNRNPGFAIEPGAIGIAADPFVWVPPDVSEHYSLVAIAETPGQPNPLRGVADITSLAEALSCNGNVAQRNVSTVRGLHPQVILQARYDQGVEGAVVDFSVLFENIPKGSSYTISSGTPLNGKPLTRSDSNTADSSFSYGWWDLAIPAQWNARFTVSLAFGSDWSAVPSGQKPRITIRAQLVQTSLQRLYRLGSEPGPNPFTGQPRRDELGAPTRLVTVGSYAITCPDMGP